LTLSSGTRLGSYEIVSAIGAGGMGEVYRATDRNLKRQVAIKVLPIALAGEAERLARFQREAEVLAALNHPNIAHIHGLEDAGGTPALVMELVEGPTLAERIAQGAIDLGDALLIARQIAEALEAAHEQGIIHRDLKPANIKVRADGTVKVLDFGLAKAMDPDRASSSNGLNSPTISMHATQAGSILGSAAYMSPEQAAGKPVDKRSDLWAFGVVLLEMLTGSQVFEGETVSHVIASVLKDDPNWTRLPADTPAPVRRLLRRCLEKDRKHRLADAADARLEIGGGADDTG
jgi:eukaryotic-like serine/threonine-protein kinase